MSPDDGPSSDVVVAQVTVSGGTATASLNAQGRSTTPGADNDWKSTKITYTLGGNGAGPVDACKVAIDGLEGYYTFSGDASDSSDKGRDGVWSGTEAYGDGQFTVHCARTNSTLFNVLILTVCCSLFTCQRHFRRGRLLRRR